MPHSISDHYPELMHYTTAAGLTGIVTSGLLWATHINFLNDSQEFNHFFNERLPHLFAKEIEIWAREKKLTTNGLEARTRKFSEEIKNLTLKVYDPYVFSLCAAANERILAHGLLSQWRGYGKDGGYVVVFDTAGLQERISHEFQNADISIFMHEVMYSKSHHWYQEWTKKLSPYLANAIRGTSAVDQPGYREAIITLATCHKHWGFEEEREVRLVRIWPNRRLLATQFPDLPPIRPPKTFIRGGAPVPYLELFADRPDGSCHLPVKRVIVGPHRDQEIRVDGVRRLLAANGYADVAVHGSAIPYLGR